MNNPNISSRDPNLSGDAQRAVQEFTEHVKGELVLRAQIYADSRGSREIERRDIHRAAREFRLPSGPPQEEKRKRVLYIGGGAGVAASIALGAAIFVGGLEQADSVAAIMGAVTGLLGISVSIPAIIKGKSGWESNSNGGVAAVPGPADIAELIAIWSDIERMISDDAPDKAKANRSGLSALLHDFSQRHNLSPDFLKEASRVAAVRNDLAHGRGGIPSDEIPGHLRRAQKLAKTVKKISERT